MRNIQITEKQVEGIACSMAEFTGQDPYLMIGLGTAQQVSTLHGPAHVAPRDPFPVWRLYRSLALHALAEAGKLLDATVELVPDVR